jgi:basic amino acid/polyamine antiporter, APA family
MEEGKFKQSLGLLDATMIVAGSMIGSGIFIVSADIARTVGSSGLLLLVWIVTGLITITAALSYGELAGMMPEAGGQFVYLKRAYNSLVGFLYGWTVFTVIQTGVIAAVAVAFAKFTAVFLPFFGTDNILFHLGSFNISAAQLLAIASIWLLTYLNSHGIKAGKSIQTFFTSTKLIALFSLIVIGIGFAFGKHTLSSNFSNPFDAFGFDAKTNTFFPLSGSTLVMAFSAAMIGSLFSSDAWNNVTFIAGEIKEPKRNIPLSLLFGTCIVTVLYVMANVAYMALLPVQGDPAGADVVSRGIMFATNDRVGTAAASMILGDPAAYVMAGLIMISTFGCNNGLILAGARVYYAMAKEGLFFKKAEELNKHNVPGYALKIQALWASVLCLSGTYGDLLEYCTFASLIFYIITIGAVFVLRKKDPDAPRPYKALGYPVIPALYIVAATAICISLLIVKPHTTGMGLFIVFLGLPVYYFTKKR